MKGYKFLRLGVHSCRDYQATLEVVCEKGSRDNYGLLNWTVAQETDDLVYYHSYTHEVSLTDLHCKIYFLVKFAYDYQTRVDILKSIYFTIKYSDISIKYV